MTLQRIDDTLDYLFKVYILSKSIYQNVSMKKFDICFFVFFKYNSVINLYLNLNKPSITILYYEININMYVCSS